MISGLTLTGSAGSCTLTVTSGVLAPGAGGAGPWCGEGAGQGPGGTRGRASYILRGPT